MSLVYRKGVDGTWITFPSINSWSHPNEGDVIYPISGSPGVAWVFKGNWEMCDVCYLPAELQLILLLETMP